MTLHQDVQRSLEKLLAAPNADDVARLNAGLRLLSKWRSVLVQNTLLKHEGTVVRQGPLKGLDFLPHSAEGCHIAKLLGCYEQPLQPHIERAIAANYPTILNIGCAEGYYAVGMARRMPATRVFAFDLNVAAQETCTTLARKNGVSARFEVGALFSPADFAAHAGGKVLVLCDIKGAERELLDPAQAPALRGMDMIVESHDCLRAGTTPPAHGTVLSQPRDHGGSRYRRAATCRCPGVVSRSRPSRPAAGDLGVALRADAVAGNEGPVSGVGLTVARFSWPAI
ncbi:MAG: hypothetical protein FJX02_14815 [Alphaproteobacteria bacterium]|nr:hypothetical protein [Alphaproteobacteria bacterium]